MGTKLKFGLLLPHFGRNASFRKILDGAKRAEEYGFDSVWVRDHLVFRPHDFEPQAFNSQDTTHITYFESFVTLAAVAAVTKKLLLGTAMNIPHRHPIHNAQLFATLSRLSGGRVIAGVGWGTYAHEFDALGLPSTRDDFRGLFIEGVQIMRRLWSEGKLSHKGTYFTFEDVEIRPQPVKKIPIWYGGRSPAACRMAVEFCDGWMPGHMPLATFRKFARYTREQCQKNGREMLPMATIPFTTIARDREASLSKVDIPGLWNEGNRNSTWVKPASGSFSRIEDMEGMLLWGTPGDIVEVTRKYEEAGLSHIVYDFRYRYDDWEEQMDLLGNEVLPQLRG